MVLNWTKYPKEELLQVAEATMDLSLSAGSAYVEAWGNRIFDYTWLFGPIRYKAKIYQNGEFLTDIVSETETFSGGITMQPGTTIKACGFYAYENLDIASNELCEEFKATDGAVSLAVPGKERNRVDIENWANSAGIQMEILPKTDTEKVNAGIVSEIFFGGECVSGGNINTTASQLGSIKIQVFIYDKGADPAPQPPGEEKKEDEKKEETNDGGTGGDTGQTLWFWPMSGQGNDGNTRATPSQWHH